MNPSALGQLCVDRRLLTEAQLERCLEIQRTGPEWRRLGDILLAEGLITGRALANLLNIQEAMHKEAPAPPAQDDVPPSELGWLLREARANGASGLVLGPGRPPAFRIGATVQPLEGPPLREAQIETMLAEAVPAGVVQEMEQHGYAEAAVEMGGAEIVHVTVYRHASGIGLSVRALDREEAPLGLRALGLAPGVQALTKERAGLILVTGPARAGKATVLRALLQSIHDSRAAHILVVENGRPVHLDAGRGIVTRRRVGIDTPAAGAALDAALGAEADVVGVTHLQDRASIASALALAQAERLVLAALPTPGAAATVTRVLDAGGDGTAEILARCLRGVVSLRLFPGRRGKPPAAASELMLSSPGMVNLVRAGQTDQIPTLLRTGGPEGMVSLEESLARLYRTGRVTTTEAMEAANDPEALRTIIGIRQEAARVRL